MLIWLLTTLAHAEDAVASSGFTLSEMWHHAGLVAKCVIVTLGIMVFPIITVLTVERAITFFLASSRSKELAQRVAKSLQIGDTTAALKILADERYKSAHLTGIIRVGVQEFVENPTEHGIENAERAMNKAAVEAVARLKRGMPILATIASTSPFVGLFGTTTGVINAFAGMSTGGSGLASISAGISEALFTTALGIFVAVVAVWLFNFFNNLIEKYTEQLQTAEVDMLNWAHKRLQARPVAVGE